MNKTVFLRIFLALTTCLILVSCDEGGSRDQFPSNLSGAPAPEEIPQN